MYKKKQRNMNKMYILRDFRAEMTKIDICISKVAQACFFCFCFVVFFLFMLFNNV